MILCSVDKSGRVLTMSYSRHVGAEEMKRCLETVRDLLEQLKPGFFVLSDMTNLDLMEASCAPDLGALMELFSSRGMARVMRVIPDPNKDIGINLISRFHLHPQVKTQTYGSLADAIRSLLPDEKSPDESVENLAEDQMSRQIEDNRAEAHFTVAARKEAEVNEGGLVGDTGLSQ